MARRILSRINSAHVIATIALFAALGGSYATAFSGSGTLQKGKGIASSTSTYSTIRTLTGIGSIQARCVNDAEDEMEVRLVNNSGEFLVASRFRESDGVYIRLGVQPGNDAVIVATGEDTIRWQVHPGRNEGKTPMADIWTDVNPGNNCDAREIDVLALNTEE